MKIAIVTDAWYPQINGVVRTLDMLRTEIESLGHGVSVISPSGFRSIPCPSYPEIRLALAARRRLEARLAALQADAIHIATEGPLGLAARRWCRRRALPFTTAFHTNFPEYIAARTGLPPRWLHPAVRRFHAPSAAVMVATPAMADELAGIGIRHTRIVPRGVDTALFRPRPERETDLPRPVSLYVGRLAVEKTVENFLALDLPGTKLVVGDGPAAGALKARFPEAVFAGALSGESLAESYAIADVFVFPSRTDTFGLVMLEALASGVPVAAFPVRGPLEIVGHDGRGGLRRAAGPVGRLDADLAAAVRGALSCKPAHCRSYARGFSWHACADAFLDTLAPLPGGGSRAAA